MFFPPDGNGPYRLLRAFGGAPVAELERSLADPEAAQRRRLRVVREAVAGSAYAAHLGLRPGGAELDLDALRAAAPIVDGAAMEPWLARIEAGEPAVLTTDRVLQLVETSGTTGRPKRLPVTRAWADSVAAAQRLWVLGLLRDDEGLAGGAALSIVSPAVAGRTAGGLDYGSNTGRMFLAQPFWVRWRAPVPYAAYTLPDLETRQYTILRHALAADVRSWTAANPASLLLYRRRRDQWWEELRRDLADGTIGRLGVRGLARKDVPDAPMWPWDLRRVNCWRGGPAAWYAARLPEALGRDVPVREAGITASEGYFAVPVDDGDPIAWLGGHVLEFVDDAGTPRWAWELEVGATYRLVVTTEAGLVRYDLGDLVRCTGHAGRAPRLVFERRAAAELNVVGERVTEAHLQAAARAAFPDAEAIAATTEPAEVPWLRVLVGQRAPLPAAAAPHFDAALAAVNVEYADRRASGRYGPPELRLLPPEAWERWKAARVAAGAPEAQVKDPVVVDARRYAELVGADSAGV